MVSGAMPGVLVEAHGDCGISPMMGMDGARTVWVGVQVRLCGLRESHELLGSRMEIPKLWDETRDWDGDAHLGVLTLWLGS